MAQKQANAGLKMALEYGPIILFFIGYTVLKKDTFTVFGTDYDGFVAVTAMFIPVLAIATFLQWRLTGHLSKMQIATLALVVVFGGLSVWFNDESFFKMKPTIIYLLFAAILGVGLLRGQSYLAAVLGDAVPLQREGWLILTRRLTFFFIALAGANEFVWRTMSTDAWVTFKTFVLTAGVFGFFMAQTRLFTKYAVSEEGEG